MSDFQRHSSTEKRNFDPKTNTEKVSKQTTDESRTTTNQTGGVTNQYHQQGAHVVETEIKETRCPVSSQPAGYTEEARRLDAAGKAFENKIAGIDQKQDRDDKLASEKLSQLEKLESEAEKAAKEFNKQQEKDLKSQSKDQAKLQKQTEKTMKMAEELAAKQAEQQAIAAEKARIAMMKDSEAKRLATELVNKRQADLDYAQQKMNELAAAEEAFKQKANELAAHQAQELRTLEIKQKETKVNVDVAKKNVEDLRRRHEAEQASLASNQGLLERLRSEAKQAKDLEMKHLTERQQLEQRIRELDQKAAQEHQNANQLKNQHDNLQGEIQSQKQGLLDNEAALKERIYLLEKQQQERKTIEIRSKEQIQNEQIALDKANNLASKAEKERREIQGDVSELCKETQEAKAKLAELQKTTNVKVEQKPATVDVYTHQQYQTTEPVVTEINRDDQKEDKSLGAKIVDGIKSLNPLSH